MRLIFSILLLVFNLSLLAQNTDQEGELVIRGTVISGESTKTEKNSFIIVIDLASKNPRRHVFVDSLGNFAIEGLSEGSYKIGFKVNARDYLASDTTIHLTEQNNPFLLIRLEKIPCKYNAKADIESDNKKILVAGGIAPRMNSKEDERFEKKYGIQYVIFGDVIIEGRGCIEDYNKEIFNYLDRRYGNKWRKKVREAAFGYHKN